MMLINEAKQLYMGDDDLDVSIQGNVFAIDATAIDLTYPPFTGLLPKYKGRDKVAHTIEFENFNPRIHFVFKDRCT